MTPKKQKALLALLTQPTKEKAATAAGITSKTLRGYLAEADFQAEYKRAFSGLVEDATRQAQQAIAPTSDVAPDAANSRSPTERSRPRERDQSTPDTDPLDPEEGKEDSRDFASRGNAAAGRGGRGDTTTQPEKHTARTTRGAGPRRGSGQSRGREREGRTRRKARVRHGKTGGDPGAHRRLPTPRPARRPSGGEESTAHAGVCTEPSPQPPTTQPEPHGSAATAGRQTGSAPRDPSPNSERGGAGRGRRESKRCARGRRSGGEPSRGPFGRDPSRP